jgi:hypothetical protein
VLTYEDARRALYDAAVACGLPADDGGERAVWRTIDSGLAAGQNKPFNPEASAEASEDDRDESAKASGGARDEWPVPSPMPTDLLPVDPFDLGFLPDKTAPWVADIAERMQCPLDFVGVAAMVTLGAVLGRKIAIRPKRKDDWHEVANLWGMIVSRSGTMKSPATEAILKPVNRLEMEARKEYKTAMAVYELKAEAYEAAKKSRKRNSSATLEPRPEAPVCRRYITNDTTYERLGEILADNPTGAANTYREAV